MTERNYGNRSGILLRLAPWADPAQVRAEFSRRLKEELESPYRTYSGQSRRLAEGFISGERIVMRSCDGFRRVLRMTLQSLYGEHVRSDRLFGRAQEEFSRYFFSSDTSLGIRK